MGTNGKLFLLTVTVGLAVAISGCAATGEDTTFAFDPLRAPPSQPPKGALKCSDAVIDPATGGTITAGTGGPDHSLHIPENQNWNEAARLRVSPLSADYDYEGVSIRPHGQKFDPAATLTISYAHCPAHNGPYVIYRWNHINRRWDDLPTTPSQQTNAVEVSLTSASDYALGTP